MGFTSAESAATLDARYPTSGASDYIAYSVNGSSETGNLARTSVGATGWAAATVADPSVKANNAVLTSAAVTSAGITVSHFALFTLSSGGVQRTDWQALTTPRALLVGDSVQWAISALAVTLT